MKKLYFLILLFWGFNNGILAQGNLGLGTLNPNEHALMDMFAIDKGLLVPRLDSVQRDAITPNLGQTERGLLTFDQSKLLFYFWNGLIWEGFPSDNNDSNEVDSISLSNDTLIMSNGSFVMLPSYNNTDSQGIDVLQLNGNVLEMSLDNDGLPLYTLDFSSMLNGLDQDSQQLTILNDTLYISNGNSIPLGVYLDNTDNQQIWISNDTVYIEDGGYAVIPNQMGSDSQLLSITGDSLTITNGNTIILQDEINDADADSTNEIQTLEIYNDSLSISNGNSIPLGVYLDNTDNQQIWISNDTVFIEDGGYAVIPNQIGIDNQTLSITGDSITITNGNTIIVQDEINDADADSTNEIQTLAIYNDSLFISKGNGVPFPFSTDTLPEYYRKPLNSQENIIIDEYYQSSSSHNKLAISSTGNMEFLYVDVIGVNDDAYTLIFKKDLITGIYRYIDILTFSINIGEEFVASVIIGNKVLHFVAADNNSSLNTVYISDLGINNLTIVNTSLTFNNFSLKLSYAKNGNVWMVNNWNGSMINFLEYAVSGNNLIATGSTVTYNLPNGNFGDYDVSILVDSELYIYSGDFGKIFRFDSNNSNFIASETINTNNAVFGFSPQSQFVNYGLSYKPGYNYFEFFSYSILYKDGSGNSKNGVQIGWKNAYSKF